MKGKPIDIETVRKEYEILRKNLKTMKMIQLIGALDELEGRIIVFSIEDYDNKIIKETAKMIRELGTEISIRRTKIHKKYFFKWYKLIDIAYILKPDYKKGTLSYLEFILSKL